MKVLISGMEIPELFIDKKVIFDEKKFPSVRRLSENFVIRITCFPFNLETSPLQVKIFYTSVW
jgi:hypothetical protein